MSLFEELVKEKLKNHKVSKTDKRFLEQINTKYGIMVAMSAFVIYEDLKEKINKNDTFGAIVLIKATILSAIKIGINEKKMVKLVKRK